MKFIRLTYPTHHQNPPATLLVNADHIAIISRSVTNTHTFIWTVSGNYIEVVEPPEAILEKIHLACA